MVGMRAFRVRPERIEDLKAWGRQLEQRRDEVLETFANETVRHEAALLANVGGEPVLIHLMEAEDLDQAHRAAEEDPLPIDPEHRARMREVLGDEVRLQTVYDISL
ncbi:MAG TPA: DUF6176 family protein [Actinomycetota bacterium]